LVTAFSMACVFGAGKGRGGPVASQRRDLEKAIALVRGLVITLARRRPAGFAAWEADAALSHCQEALLRLRVLGATYEKHGGEFKPLRPTDRVEEAV
jgi:hypothetical protein